MLSDLLYPDPQAAVGFPYPFGSSASICSSKIAIQLQSCKHRLLDCT